MPSSICSWPSSSFCSRLPHLFPSQLLTPPTFFCVALRLPCASVMTGNSDIVESSHGKPVVDTAVIVGGGLGGLAAALQLRKAGIDVQVYERNARISGGEGTLISLFPNGCKALNQANPDVVIKMRGAGLTDVEATIVTPDGTKIGEWELNTQMEKRFGQPMIAILWKDALRILSEALPENCIHTGYECLNVSQDDDIVVVDFKKGSEIVSIKAPLVIGADGIRSAVRTALFGNIPPRDNGRTMWRAVIDSTLCSHKGLRVGTLVTQFQGHTVFIVNGVQGKLYWAFSVEDDCCEGTTKIRSKDQTEAKERLMEYFKGWDLATNIIEATDPGLILERRVLDMPVLSNWSKGSVVLLGDAVHAVTPALGQGANLAYEDGLQLAILLASCSDLRSALEKYEEVRIPRASKVSGKSQDRNAMRDNDFYDWLYNTEPFGKKLSEVL